MPKANSQIAGKKISPASPNAGLTNATFGTQYVTSNQNNQGISLNNQWLLGLTSLVAAAYFLYSIKSNGFYQQDEANHFTSMMRFWDAPNSVLSNWAKPGYKLIYAVPALLGKEAVTLLNCLFAAFSCFFAYKTAEAAGAKNPLIAFFLLATQPFFIALAFRNYSEIPVAFMLSLASYAFLKNKYWAAALLVSYVCTIRQEFIPIASILGVWLLYKKQFLAFLCLGVFLLAQNIWGGIVNNDPLYLLHQITGGSEKLGDLYPRQGFDHYFKTSIAVFGFVAVTLFVTYVGASISLRKQPLWVVLVPAVGYFLINCLINWQAHHFGPSTGGNLRYVLVIAPYVAIIGALALDRVAALTNKFLLLFTLIPLVVLVGAYLNHKHNYVMLTDEKDVMPMLGVIFTSVVLFIPGGAQFRTLMLLALMALGIITGVKAVPLGSEDKACKDLVAWYKTNENLYKSKPLFVEHPMFYYFIGRTETGFSPQPVLILPDLIEKAPVGSLIIWDSHYSYRPQKRPNSLNYTYFTEKPDTYQLVHQIMSDNEGFGILIFQKLK